MAVVRDVYNQYMAIYRYGREQFEEGEYARRSEAVPGDGLDPVVRIMDDLGTIEVPCGKVDCRVNCSEYLVRAAKAQKAGEEYALAECKLTPLVSII